MTVSRRALVLTAAVLAVAAVVPATATVVGGAATKTTAAATTVAAAVRAPVPAAVATRPGVLVDTAPADRVPLAAKIPPRLIDTICPPSRPTAPAKAKPAAAPVRDAFGVLRRERTSRDSLSPEAAGAVADAGYGSADLEAARLLRTTAAGGKAWIVPVAEVQPLGALPVCALLDLARRAGTSRRGRIVTLPRIGGAPLRPGLRRAIPPAAVRRLRPRGPILPLPPVSAPLRMPDPGPGVIVVATGDAPGGAGGTLPMLVRGLAPVEVRPCTGREADLLSVSGLVPDGVGFVHLTRTDGTAVRADVKDNAYAFRVPGDPEPGQTYVTWTGGDGTPHVQPLAHVATIGEQRCSGPTMPPTGGALPRVSPGAGAGGLLGRFSRPPGPPPASSRDPRP